jgi:hypothetical protein
MVHPQVVHLPNGQTLTVTTIFGGLYFKSNDLSLHHGHCPFPPGWTVVLNSEYEVQTEEEREEYYNPMDPTGKPRAIHPYHKPTLQNDHMFISSISNPPSSEFKPASSQARQIAMMLWASLYWYFHQPEPAPHVNTEASTSTPVGGKPRGEWRISINREGVFKTRTMIPKLERMGLIATEESSVGVDPDERLGEGWEECFVSRRSFWQLDARIYLFTLSPAPGSPWAGNTPVHSRPGSPTRQGEERDIGGMSSLGTAVAAATGSVSLGAGGNGGTGSPGPFTSASHLPTYYPPPPPQYVYTNGVRHPIRPKPGRQGEVVYNRYIPSVAQFLSFRVASLQPRSTQTHHHGKGSLSVAMANANNRASISDSILPTIASLGIEFESDVELLHRWMNDERIAHFWGEKGPKSHQEEFLKKNLKSKHSVPLIGCWDGKPFGYFEIYWVKEDVLGRQLGDVGNYDRGIHCLVGEQEFRGPQRVRIWLSALLHHCWLNDNRTEVVMMEPRVDNEK